MTDQPQLTEAPRRLPPPRGPRVHPRCSEPGCGKQAKARGLCAHHYAQAQYRGTLPPKLEVPSTWTPAFHNRLVALVEEGHGPSEIARQLGLNKNQVVGRMHRHGLCSFADDTSSTMTSRLRALWRQMHDVLHKTGADQHWRWPEGWPW